MTDHHATHVAPEVSVAPVVEEKIVDKSNMTPQEFLATLPGAPSADQIATWKSQAPNNRLDVLSPDGKRAFILRGLTGLELTQIQKQVQQIQGCTDPDLEMQIAAVVKATVWTNVGQSGKLTDIILRTGTAGLPSALFTKISKLSDFMDPQTIEYLSAEL
ncbi:MAG: hypothetical protein WA766_11695 [Candidatus Acidiferrales bacterium]